MRYHIQYRTKCGLWCEKSICPIDGFLPKRIVRNGRIYVYKSIIKFNKNTYIFEEQ